MTAKEYLKQVRRCDVEIEQLRNELEQVFTVLTSATSDPSKEHVDGGQSNRLNMIEKSIDLQEKISAKLIDRSVLRSTIVLQIQSLGNDKYTWVLYKRYVDFKKWEELAEVPPYYVVIDTIYKWHGQALQEFAERFSECLQ